MGSEPRKREVVEIGSEEYSILPFGALKGMKLLFELAEMVGPWAVSFVKAIFDKGFDSEEADLGDIDTMDLASLPQRILEKGGSKKIVEILEGTTFLGDRDQRITADFIDSHFPQRYGDLFELVYHVLRVNYAPFLIQISEKLKKRLGALSEDQQIQS